MLFKRLRYYRYLLAACVWVVVTTSCGRFGQKDDLDSLLRYLNQDACLDDMGPRFQSYFKGEIDPAKWEATWDCAITALGHFKRFIKGSGVDGAYTQADLQAFLGKFMVTKKPVTADLISSNFDLKASLFGGGSDALSMGELDRFIDMLKIGKRESTRLIPFLAKRAHHPSIPDLFALSDAVAAAGTAIGQGLSTHGNAMLTRASIQKLVTEVSKMVDAAAPSDDMATWVASGKALLLAGSAEGIAGDEWPSVFRAFGAYGGPALAAVSADTGSLVSLSEKGGFFVELGSRIKVALDDTLDLHGGALPLTELDRVIDDVPASWLSVNKDILKQTLRPLTNRLFRSQTPDAIDHSVLDLLLSEAQFWNRGQDHLENIFHALGPDPSGALPEDFADAANRYAQGADDLTTAEINRLVFLSSSFGPLLLEGDQQITFAHIKKHTLNDLSRYHWVRIVAEHLLKSYGSSPDGNKGSEADLYTLVGDYKDLLADLKQIDKTDARMPSKRFREANLFMPNSNGDKFMDVEEATYYLNFLLSAGELSKRILDEISTVCPSTTLDPYGWGWMKIDCFRREYFARRRVFWDHFPEMVRYYEGLNATDQHNLEVSMEQSARRYGYNDKPIGKFDVDGYAGILHYLEAMFNRYNTNETPDQFGNQFISLKEIMGAYPVFKGSLAELGHIDPSKEAQLEAIFTYTVRFGAPPVQDFWGISHFLAWWAWKPFWTIHADRKDLYKVIGAISAAAPPS